jgi:serine/threonine protein kinase
MTQYRINPNYQKEFISFLKNIKSYFSSSDATIHKARNEIKLLTHANHKVAVKAFKVPHAFNRVVYSFFRESKAKKSYEYSMKISKFVPTPIGYIEFKEMGLLKNSYFISEAFEYDFTIREPLLDINFPNKEDILKAFARFTWELHENEILHKDYSPGNILIKEESGAFIFKIVDINRMEFKPLGLDERLKNFSMLWAKDEDMRIIAKEYALKAGADESYAVEKAIKESQKLKDFKNMKKRLKGKKVVD